MTQDKITIRIYQRHGAPVAVFDALLVEVLNEDGTGHRVGTNALRKMLIRQDLKVLVDASSINAVAKTLGRSSSAVAMWIGADEMPVDAALACSYMVRDMQEHDAPKAPVEAVALLRGAVADLEVVSRIAKGMGLSFAIVN